MKKFKLVFIFLFLAILFIDSSYCMGQDLKTADKGLKDTTGGYWEGSYEGRSRAKYVGEPYWGIVNLTFRNDSLTEINFMIRDSTLHETFNENYEKHFEGNPVYIEQSRNDWRGVQTYPKMLSATKGIDKIDAISGATWSYNIFKASVYDALKNARMKADTVAMRDTLK